MGLRLSRWGRPGGPEGGVAARALFLKAPRRRAAWVPAGEVVGERLRPSADLGVCSTRFSLRIVEYPS